MDQEKYCPVKLSNNGYLWAGSLHFDQNMSKLVHGHAVVIAHSHSILNDVSQSSLNQTISISIHVLPVAYIMLYPKRFPAKLSKALHKHGSASYLGQGGPYEFDIGFHDYLGRRFDVVSGTPTSFINTSLL